MGRIALVFTSLYVPSGSRMYETLCRRSMGWMNFKIKLFWWQLSANSFFTSSLMLLLAFIVGDGAYTFFGYTFSTYFFSTFASGFGWGGGCGVDSAFTSFGSSFCLYLGFWVFYSWGLDCLIGSGSTFFYWFSFWGVAFSTNFSFFLGAFSYAWETFSDCSGSLSTFFSTNFSFFSVIVELFFAGTSLV